MNPPGAFSGRVHCFAEIPCCSILLLTLAFAPPVFGAASVDPLTGYYYQEFSPAITWDAARTNCPQQFVAGIPGHLVTVSSLRENLIVQHLGGTDEKWIGLTDSTATSTLDGFNLSSLGTFEAGNTSALPLPAPGVTPAGTNRGAGFQWITGEPYTWLNWRNGTPSGSTFGSDGVYMLVQGVWQDSAAGASLGEPGGPTLRKHVAEFEVDLTQDKFRLLERQAAPSFRGNGNVPNLAAAEELLALPDGHPDVAATATNRAYVVSFHDPDLGGGPDDVVRSPTLLNTVGLNDNDMILNASGRVVIPQAGEWTFAVATGDGFRLRAGSNNFTGTGILPSAAPRLAIAGQGTLTPAPGGGGQTFYFDQPGTYELVFTGFDSGFFGFYQIYAALGQHTNFNAGVFKLVGDEINGGLAIACPPRTSGSFTVSFQQLPGGTYRFAWEASPCASYRLEFSEDLAGWNPVVSGIFPTAASASVDHQPLTPQGFYRVAEVY